MAARERCVPGGERGSFEDHGEGDPDVLVSPANRRGTKASMCVPRRESSRPRLPGGAGSICSANPTQPRTLDEKPNRLSRLLPARIRIVSMRIDCAIDRCLRRPPSTIERYCPCVSQNDGGRGGRGREEGEGEEGRESKRSELLGGVKVRRGA